MRIHIKKIHALFFVFAVITLLFLSSLVPLSRKIVLTLLSLPLKGVSFLEREIGGLLFFHQNMLKVESLQKENSILKRELIKSQEVYLEYQRLQDLLGLKKSLPYKSVAARLIGRAADNWSSVVFIDKGSNSGIKRGLVVVNNLGLVGRVIDVQPITSTVMLLSDPHFSVSALVQRSRQEGLVCGALGDNLLMRYLPLDADIKVDDIVITSGLSENFPKGLIIGKVLEVNTELSGLSRYATIKPAVKLGNLEEVLVIFVGK